MSAANGAPAPASAEAAAPEGAGVWSSLLGKSARRSREANSTLVLLGDKRCGKSSLLAKFSDRTSADTLPSLSSASNSSSGSVPSLLANGSAPGGEHALDYSFCAVKNRHVAPGAGDKDEVLARMHVWQLDEPQHAPLVSAMLLQSAQSPAAAAPAAARTATLDYAALDRACFVITFDLSEPWRAVDSVREWLAVLARVLNPALAALPEAQAQALRAKVSRYVQSYHSPSAEDAADGAESLVSPGGGSPSPPPASSSPSPLASGEAAGPPVDPAIPEHNLGVPIIVAGLKADSFGRHYHSGRSSSSGSSTTGRGALDEKFDFLARKLRRLCLQWGATLIYTSVAHVGGGGRSSKDAGVNVELLQHYILHRLYRFPLNPAAGAAAAAAAAAAASASSPDAAASKAGGSAFAAAATAATAAKRAAQFQPRLLGSVEDDFGLYVPAGYDSAALLDTSASSGISAAFSDATSLDEVLPNPYAARNAKAAQAPRSSAGGQAEAVQAEDNTVFYKNLKYQLELGGGGAGLALAAPSAVSAPSHARTATSSGLAGVAAGAAVSPAAGGAAVAANGDKAASSPAKSGAPVTATAGAGAPGAVAPAKGQIAVKQFFRSLLNNTSASAAGAKPGEAGAKSAAAQKAAVRAGAEQELKRMTGDAAQPPPPAQQ